MDWRYCYHNRLYLRSGAGHGVLCNPLRYYDDGRCVAHGGRHGSTV